MKLRMALCSTAFLALAAAPSFAQVVVAEPAPAVIVDTAPAYPAGTIYVPGARPFSNIHGGWVAPGDDVLLGNAVAALQSEPGLNNMTVTMVAKNGELIVDGVANDLAQAARIERIAKRVANGHVTSRFTTQMG
jgi:hypothetical protein